MILVGNALDVTPCQGCRVAVAVVLPRSFSIKIDGTVRFVHGKLHPIAEQVGQLLNAACILHNHIHVNHAIAGDVICDCYPGLAGNGFICGCDGPDIIMTFRLDAFYLQIEIAPEAHYIGIGQAGTHIVLHRSPFKAGGKWICQQAPAIYSVICQEACRFIKDSTPFKVPERTGVAGETFREYAAQDN